MARSRHTDPPKIRAQRRVDDMDGSRGDGDRSRARTQARLARSLGVELSDAAEWSPTPRRHQVAIRVTPPPAGYIHPASEADIRQLLEFLGPLAQYGLRSVELRHPEPSAGLLIAQFRTPGRVLLYAQLASPWVVPGSIATDARDVLVNAGATVDVTPAVTRVEWSSREQLRDFMLFDGLAHEIGHHLVQHHTGKRTARVMRTRDHEFRAHLFASECRALWRATQ